MNVYEQAHGLAAAIKASEEFRQFDELRKRVEANPDLNGMIKRGAAAAGLKRIDVHGLRHSHVSLLINNGFNALAIGDRVGHEAQEITYRYAHLFNEAQKKMASALDQEMEEMING